MKLQPTQVFGLFAVVVFGSMLVRQLTQPKHDPFSLPGAIPLDTRAYDQKVIQEGFGPGATTSPVVPPPPPANIDELVKIGSDDAKDDLYCSGLINAAHKATQYNDPADAQKQSDRIIALAERGTGKLIANGAADKSQTAAIADAHAAKAMTDFGNGEPRIRMADCEARADAK